jgi:hypothetical protein
MKTFEPKFSFGIVSSRQFLEKLEQEYSDFDKDHISARHAINCALTSWHLSDWTYSEYFSTDPAFQDSIEPRKSGILKYQEYLIQNCEELKYMRLIANGSKHCILRNATIKNKTVQYVGSMSYEDFNREDFDVDRFEMILEDGRKIDFEDSLLKTITFWKAYLDKLTK